MKVYVLVADGEDGSEVLGVFGARSEAEREAVRIAKREGYVMDPIPNFSLGTYLNDGNGNDTGLSVWTFPITRTPRI